MTARHRVDIAAMLADKTAAADKQATPPAPKPKTPRGEQPRTRAPSNTTPPRAHRPNDGPKWKQCEPHTFYVWPDSVDQLQQLARRLQRARPKGVGERITMATLVRVAIARLLETGDHLAGVNEDELLHSYRANTQPKMRA